MNGVLLLAGPTASGKTALALMLAAAFDAEIVGADSRQIYRDMSIGTAAPSADAQARVRHHLIGFLDPHERYSAARFVRDAIAAIDDISARGKRAIVVGGTGFYLRALAGDIVLSAAYDAPLRARLAAEARIHDTAFLAAWLQALEPARAATIDPSDSYRVTRALEIALAARSGSRHPDALAAPQTLRTRNIRYRKAYLEIDTETLERNIAARTDAMLAGGLFDEADRVGSAALAADAVGYRETLAYLAGWSTLAELRVQLARNTRRYAKRQATWFRTEPDLVRLPDDPALWRALAREIPGWA